jgi:hypothetical protein
VKKVPQKFVHRNENVVTLQRQKKSVCGGRSTGVKGDEKANTMKFG